MVLKMEVNVEGIREKVRAAVTAEANTSTVE